MNDYFTSIQKYNYRFFQKIILLLRTFVSGIYRIFQHHEGFYRNCLSN